MRREVEFDGGRKLILIEGDITRIAVDAIANAANSRLAGGGGVDGAVHRRGGQSIMAELDSIRQEVGWLAPGKAVATGAGSLPAQFVFHTVGPVWHGGTSGEPESLACCYRTCLRMAEERGLCSISFPSISTGVYGYPIELAAPVAVDEIATFLCERAAFVKQVWMVLFGVDAYEAYDLALAQIE